MRSVIKKFVLFDKSVWRLGLLWKTDLLRCFNFLIGKIIGKEIGRFPEF